MIIKSMSRKSRSFSQLFCYMRDGSSQNSPYDFFSHNVYSRSDTKIIAEFLDNSRRVKSRKNGNYLFHEVISITKSSQLTLEQEKERLYDIVNNYVRSRCNRNLVVGYLHDEKDHNVHYHLMISSNELDAYKNQRMTKFEFDKAKRQLESYVIERYPELEQDILINASREQKKSRESNKAAEVKRKGGRLERKEKIIAQLKEIFSQSRDKDELFSKLADQQIEMYSRGTAIGFLNLSDGKKYRLKTLDLEEEFSQVKGLTQPVKTQEQKAKKNDKAQTNSNVEPISKQKTESARKESKAQDHQPESPPTQSGEKYSTIEENKERIKQSRATARKSREAKGKDKGFER